MSQLVKWVKLNKLEYNSNRDPQAYRRVVGKPFCIDALLSGQGQARAKIEVEGGTRCNRSIDLPGKFTCMFSLDTPGTRIATLVIEGAGEIYRRDLRLDVTAQKWVG